MILIHGQKMTIASGWNRQRAVSNHPGNPIEVLKSVGEMSNSALAVEHRLNFAKAGRSTRDMSFEDVIATMRTEARESSSYLAKSARSKELAKAGRRAAADANIARMERQLEGSRGGYTERRIQQTLPVRYD